MVENEIDSIYIKGYCITSIYCRKQFKNGGVAILHKKNLIYNCTELEFLKNFSKEKIIEVCGIEISIGKTKIKIINVYRSPLSTNLETFFLELHSILNKICENSKAKIILSGDLNIDKLSESDAKHELLNILTNLKYF